jgi:SAM-dependent methyltransferase
MGRLLDIVTPLHKSSKRDYLARMVDDKVKCMLKAKEYEFDYWDGERHYGYGGYKYMPGRWKPVAEQLIQRYNLKPGSKVLDVGCGQGLALEQFQRLGLEAVGITLGSDSEVCRAKGFEVHRMDQNFMNFADGAFDLLWCRHVLEHSVAPLFTLSEYRRVVKSNGLVYIEVPAPDTSAHHETNPNHYSVLPASSWMSLFSRAGFAVERSLEINFTVPCGPDTYWSFLLRRGA